MNVRDHMIVQTVVILIAAGACGMAGSYAGAGLLIFGVFWYFVTPNDPQP